MANWMKEEVDQLGDRLDGLVRLAGAETQAAIGCLAREMEAQRKEGIAEVGDRLDQAIQLAGAELQTRVQEISQELHTHRTLTREDLEGLIDYAVVAFGNTLDQRIDKVKQEASTLVTAKVLELREQLTAATVEQKRATFRNVSMTLAGSLIIGAISLAYGKFLHGELNLINVFRAILFTLTSGQLIWFLIQMLQKFRKSSVDQKKLVFAAVNYFGILRPEGLLGQLALFLVLTGCLLLLNFWKPILHLVTGG